MRSVRDTARAVRLGEVSPLDLVEEALRQSDGVKRLLARGDRFFALLPRSFRPARLRMTDLGLSRCPQPH